MSLVKRLGNDLGKLILTGAMIYGLSGGIKSAEAQITPKNYSYKDTLTSKETTIVSYYDSDKKEIYQDVIQINKPDNYSKIDTVKTDKDTAIIFYDANKNKIYQEKEDSKKISRIRWNYTEENRIKSIAYNTYEKDSKKKTFSARQIYYYDDFGNDTLFKEYVTDQFNNDCFKRTIKKEYKDNDLKKDETYTKFLNSNQIFQDINTYKYHLFNKRIKVHNQQVCYANGKLKKYEFKIIKDKSEKIIKKRQIKKEIYDLMNFNI